MNKLTLIGIHLAVLLVLLGALFTPQLAVASENLDDDAVLPGTMSEAEYQPLRKKLETQKCRTPANSTGSGGSQTFPLANSPRCDTGYGQGYAARIKFNNQIDDGGLRKGR
ncbi:MAG: hypothetical protein WC742_04250 [Gallionellaceae bacterium]|jgi:hypothetical protein